MLSVLEGQILNEGSEMWEEVSGEVTIALPAGREHLLFSSPDTIVVCGDQPDMIRRALETNVCCLILCQTEVDQTLLADAQNTCIISSPYDAQPGGPSYPIRPSPSPALATLTTSSASICRTISTMCGKWC